MRRVLTKSRLDRWFCWCQLWRMWRGGYWEQWEYRNTQRRFWRRVRRPLAPDIDGTVTNARLCDEEDWT